MTTSKRKPRVVTIHERDTDKEIHRIETTLVGSNCERFLDGLFNKVDFERFYVRTPEDDDDSD